MQRAWLERLLAQGESLTRIGELAGKHHSTVAYWIKKHGLEAAHREKFAPKRSIQRLTLSRLVEEGLTLRRWPRN